jgi:serine phosphatase RsbU (regulator of sigma subunit)
MTPPPFPRRQEILMQSDLEQTGDLVGDILVALDQQQPYELLTVLHARLQAALSTRSVRVWLADYEESTLEPLTVETDESRPPSTSVDAPGLGHAYRDQDVVIEHVVPGGTDVGVLVMLPITLRSERIGVLEVVLETEPGPDLLARLRPVATAVAYVLLAARRYTDVFEMARRRKELELPAEMQWDLLPVLAHTGPDFSLAGSVEPAYDIGGDNFDYAVDVAGITVSLTDAMGHGTQAALLSTLAIAAQRNARRRGHGLRQQVRAVNVAVHDHFSGNAFATGMFLNITGGTGEGIVVNAGHSLLWRLRGGDLQHCDVPPDLPTGLFDDAEYIAHPMTAEQGDRYLIISDGVLEASNAEGEHFGTERFRASVLDSADADPVETVRLLTRSVSEFSNTMLADDATAVCLDYRRS